MPSLMAEYISRHAQRNKLRYILEAFIYMKETTDFNMPREFKNLF